MFLSALPLRQSFPVGLCQPSEPLLVIGDVHGQVDQLEKALNAAEALIKQGRVSRVVFLGDLIDRGPDSLGCLRLIADFRSRHETVLLLGNHEQFMFVTLMHANASVRDLAAYNWVSNKGAWAIPLWGTLLQTLRQLGLGLDAWHASYSTGNVLLVHAGIPMNATEGERGEFLSQGKLDLPKGSGISHPHWAWIRTGFLEADVPWSRHFVVHGHTKNEFTGSPLVGRLNLDATAHHSVAAALLENGCAEVFLFGEEG